MELTDKQKADFEKHCKAHWPDSEVFYQPAPAPMGFEIGICRVRGIIVTTITTQYSKARKPVAASLLPDYPERVVADWRAFRREHGHPNDPLDIVPTGYMPPTV